MTKSDKYLFSYIPLILQQNYTKFSNIVNISDEGGLLFSYLLKFHDFHSHWKNYLNFDNFYYFQKLKIFQVFLTTGFDLTEVDLT